MINCIYTFRGSNYSLIKRFQDEHHAKLIVLEENYRCTKSILNAANNLIKNNVDRFDKDLYTNNDKTFKLNFFLAKTDKEEACYSANSITKLLENGYKHEDICVLYRNNQLSVNLEKELTTRKIPFILHGSHPFLSHKEIKSLINHYLFLLNHDDSFALSMIISYPNKLLKEKSVTDLNKLLSSSKKTLYALIKESEDPKAVDLSSYLQDLIDHFEELNHIDFCNYLINKIKLFDAFKEENNVKDKTARILEFKTFIQELSDTKKKEALKEFIDNIYLQNTSDKVNKDLISMMTIHQSKGFVYKVIIILGFNQGILTSSKTKMLNNEEEIRIFYVAITRSKDRLFLVAADRRFINEKYQIYAHQTFY